MKKILQISLIGLIGFSCKKAKDEIRVGDEKRMFTQGYCMKIAETQPDVEEFFDTGYSYRDTSILLDIDLDGINDIKLQSIAEFKQDPIVTYTSSIKIVNQYFSLSRNLKKLVYYQGLHCNHSPSYQNFGSHIRVTYRIYDGCKKEYPCGQIPLTYFSPEHKFKFELIDNNIQWNNKDSMSLKKRFDIYGIFEFNEAEDTMTRIIRERNLTCLNLPSDQEIYIPISKLVGNERYLGWIKILLSEENTIEILETAIQEH